MSQPCLPVKSHRHNKKRRRRDRSPQEDDGDEPKEEDIVTFDDIESMDATEYLSRVVKQAKKLPDTFHVPIIDTRPSKRQREHVPIDGSAASLQYLNSPRASLTAAPTEYHLPRNTTVWTETSLKSFESLRNYLDDCRSNGVGGKLTNRLPLPPMKDRSGWHMFCVGKADAQGNAGSYFGDDDNNDNDAVDDDESSDIPEWQRNIPENGHPPSVQLVLQIDQVLVRRVLSHLAHYFCAGWPLTQQRSAWLYALLARLEKPVHREDAAILFGMLKVLTRLRSNVKDTDDDDDKTTNHNNNNNILAKLNTLILVVGIYFGQGGGAVMKCTTTKK